MYDIEREAQIVAKLLGEIQDRSDKNIENYITVRKGFNNAMHKKFVFLCLVLGFGSRFAELVLMLISRNRRRRMERRTKAIIVLMLRIIVKMMIQNQKRIKTTI